ncbi:MAG: sigma-E factor negative regulatory protein [Cellvibrionaceae bacterium]
MANHSNQSQRASGMNESLSALVDGEVSEMELHRVLKATESDEQLRENWSRYNRVGQAMRGDLPQAPMMDLSASIREAIDAEDSHQIKASSSWAQKMSRVAVAASVAAVMVVTSQMIGVGGEFDDAQVADAGVAVSSDELLVPNPAASLPAGFQVPSVSARTVSSHAKMPVQESQPRYYPVVTKAKPTPTTQAPAPEVQAYLQRVMEVHADNAALNSSRGMLPYARVPVVEPAQK